MVVHYFATETVESMASKLCLWALPVAVLLEVTGMSWSVFQMMMCYKESPITPVLKLVVVVLLLC